MEKRIVELVSVTVVHEKLEEECRQLRQELNDIRATCGSDLGEELRRLRNEAAQQERIIAVYQNDNGKLTGELNAVKVGTNWRNKIFVFF